MFCLTSWAELATFRCNALISLSSLFSNFAFILSSGVGDRSCCVFLLVDALGVADPLPVMLRRRLKTRSQRGILVSSKYMATPADIKLQVRNAQLVKSWSLVW